MKDGYHHGNLKQELIDTGIRIFNSEGEQGLSLRKVAAACGVSHAAPYAHFKDKEDLLEAMKKNVTEKFTEYLSGVVSAVDGDFEDLIERKIVELGKGYVRFFLENPEYFNFIFYGQKISVHLGANDDYSEDYGPYRMFRELFEQYIESKLPGISDLEKETRLIKAWIVVHGLSSVVCMENVEVGRPWEEFIQALIV